MLVLLMVGIVWSVQLDPAHDQGQVLIVPDIEYLKDRQEPVYTNGWTEELVLNRPKFQKPQPHEYLTADHIIRHLKKFDYGGAFIAPKAYIDKYQEYVGTEDGQYIIPRKEMDYLLNKANGNVEIIEKELGLKPGTFRDRNLKRVDIPFPFKFDLRMPSGNEHQALDSWVPGGVNVRGYSEAIISTVPKGEFRIHEIIYPFR